MRTDLKIGFILPKGIKCRHFECFMRFNETVRNGKTFSAVIHVGKVEGKI